VSQITPILALLTSLANLVGLVVHCRRDKREFAKRSPDGAQ
jgi:hypothetical protein